MTSSEWSRPIGSINRIFGVARQIVELDPVHADVTDAMPGYYINLEKRAFIERLLTFQQNKTKKTHEPTFREVQEEDRAPRWPAVYYNLDDLRMSYWTLGGRMAPNKIIAGEALNIYDTQNVTTLTLSNHRAQGAKREQLLPVPPIGTLRPTLLENIHDRLQHNLSLLQLEQAAADATPPSLKFVRGDLAE